MSMRALYALALIVMAAEAAEGNVWANFVDSDQELLKWIEAEGGRIDFRVGKTCPTCMRGAFAKKDFKANEVIARIPLKTGIMLGHAGEWTLPGALAEAYADPAFNDTHAIFWRSQPPPEGVFCMEMFTEELKTLTQSREVRAIIDNNNGQHKYQWQRLIRRRPNMKLSLDRYMYYAALSTSRAFSIYGDHDSTHTTEQWLVAAADLLNSWQPYNVRRDTTPHPKIFSHDGTPQFGFMELFAERDLKEGEELVHTYGHTHRNDVSLLVYGFVQRLDPPLLCSIDLPSFKEDNPWDNTPEEDDTYYDGLSAAESEAELKRLQSRLKNLPTTQAEDEAEIEKLKKAGPLDWKKEVVLQFRVERKRSLAYRIEKIKAKLDGGKEL